MDPMRMIKEAIYGLKVERDTYILGKKEKLFSGYYRILEKILPHYILERSMILGISGFERSF